MDKRPNLSSHKMRRTRLWQVSDMIATDWWDASGRNIRDYKYFKSAPKVIMRYIVRVKLKVILIAWHRVTMTGFIDGWVSCL